MERWESQGRVIRWQSGKGGRVVRWQGGGSLVLFKGGGCRVTPRIHLMVSDVNQWKEKAGWIRDFLVWP